MDPEGGRVMSRLYKEHNVICLFFLQRTGYCKRRPDFPGMEELYFGSLTLGMEFF